jgi:hypothetical protein
MIKKIIFIIIAMSIIWIFFFRKKGYDINWLKHNTETYEQIPFEVQNILDNQKKYQKSEFYDGLFDVSNKGWKIREFEIGPWSDYTLIYNEKDKFKITDRLPIPYIIFNDKLYLPIQYNVYNKKKAEKSFYEVYDLNSKLAIVRLFF